ncbi:hypothetical protein HYFRA_00004946 [Hymenoscyphus fraxineus]|uniref:tRNA nucleotidyltransferase n=1 Tax=Hymenoscyphus fraxineus TaxID=746836 RepID=A0A9N9KNP1_9HELO|nr:hypothetical protein HYFRA_00004946 [Hymenoscyphus fraxineus]
MLCLFISPLKVSTGICARQILRVTTPVITANTFKRKRKFSSYSLMKRKEADSELASPHEKKKPRVTTMATQKLQLTAQEQRLRGLLLDVANFIDEAKELKEKIELRFAGGWVRDRLLNIPSHDIDTAINSLTGVTFCEYMAEFITDPANVEKHNINEGEIGRLHTIAKNPEKSKHLETTTVLIFGFDVDFVNLRKETYTDDSRNPQVEFGTAEEDALRRDATINAMFYNLKSDQVEDFCGGLQDLKAKLIKTPLEPLTTFTDDPLRVLRLIRFASRLNFRIDQDTEVAMTDPAVTQALMAKITRERVGIEVEKMLKGKDPRAALRLIDRLGLYKFIFIDPTVEAVELPSTTNWSLVYEFLYELKGNETPGSIWKSLVRSEDAQFAAWVLAALTPWSKIPLPKPTAAGKQLPPLPTLVAQKGVKLNGKICDIVTGCFRNFKEITNLRDSILKKEPLIHERDTLGMMVRRWDNQGKNWRLQVLLAILVESMTTNESNKATLLGNWQQFIEHLEVLDLMDAPSLKPLVNGNELRKALGGIKAGIWMKPALDVCLEWQLRNPGNENKEEAIEEVKKRKEELKIPSA